MSWVTSAEYARTILALYAVEAINSILPMHDSEFIKVILQMSVDVGNKTKSLLNRSSCYRLTFHFPGLPMGMPL
jgi:hypothetical protein